ncbi:MAG: ATP-binding protein [Scytonema sp. PMC 1069.18]|nr:ATP-binding protein [Scytonema sp. PMC 1069.18]MEC4884749.1 ATP-binding protein [Scytonema sp. PMC 1070.18]
MYLIRGYCTYISRDRLTRYSVAVLSVIVALLLTLLLQPLVKSTLFSLFFASVTFSAWYGGLEAGLLATILSILASNFFLPPIANEPALRHGANFLHLLLSGIVALLVGSLYANLSTAKQKAETNLAKLQLSEERYRRIVDTAYEGIWLVNARLETQYVNQRLVEMLGYNVEEMSDRSFDKLVAETVGIETAAILAQWQQGNRQRFDCRFHTQNGSLLWAIVSTTPIFTHGKFCGVLLMLTDITERKLAETERTELLMREQVARTEAEAANRSKDEFLAILSHELRSPLNPILGWVEMLQNQTLNQDTTNYALKTIERNAKLQTKLIEDLLDISRIIHKKISLDLHPVNLVNTIEAAIETVILTAQDKAISLSFFIDGLEVNIESEFLASNPKEYYIMGDSNRLQQIVWNLLSNAIKFTPLGGQVDIELSCINSPISCELLNSTQKLAQIQVKDTGIGIKSEFLPYVFESFRQADNDTTRNFSGLGLGLAIVHHLVKLHNGTVEVQSLGEGLGTTFIVSLPLLQNKDEIEKNYFSTLSHLSNTSSILTGLKVLVVDDEPDFRELIVVVLEQYGAIVTKAASAEQALDILANSEQDLLLSDIGMPKVNGYTLMNQIRNGEIGQNQHISAIALTGYAQELDRQQAQLAGFQKHLTKPIAPAELIAAIVNLTGRSLENCGI